MEELKRALFCPKCGALYNPEVAESVTFTHCKMLDDPKYHKIKVECQRCRFSSGSYDTKEEALADWNRRVRAWMSSC